MGDGTRNYGKVAKCDLLLGEQVCLNYHRRKKKEALLYVYLIVFFILVFFLVMSMSPFFVVMLGEQIREVAVTHQLTSYHSPKTNFQTVLI